MARKTFTEHPEFMKAGTAANLGLQEALEFMGLVDRDLFQFDVSSNRVVDDLTRLLLRAYDAKHRAAA